MPGDMAYARYYGILLVEIGVGVTVMFSMIGIYIILASNGRFKREVCSNGRNRSQV